MAKLYSNENFPIPIVRELRKLGHDVLTSFDAGQANQGIPDNEVLAYAHDLGRAVITLNRKDFKKLHREGKTHSGIVLCKEDADPVRAARRIDRNLNEVACLDREMISVRRED